MSRKLPTAPWSSSSQIASLVFLAAPLHSASLSILGRLYWLLLTNGCFYSPRLISVPIWQFIPPMTARLLLARCLWITPIMTIFKRMYLCNFENNRTQHKSYRKKLQKEIKTSFIIAGCTIPVLIAYFRVVWQCVKISSRFCGWSANSQLYSWRSSLG